MKSTKEMTPAQKAAETRKANREKQHEKAEAAKFVKNAIISACLDAIMSEEVSAPGKLKAATMLYEVRKEKEIYY